MKIKDKSIDHVRAFWEGNPLFTGEGKAEAGTREWFEEWEKVYTEDCLAGKSPEKIYTDGLTPDIKILDVGCGPGFWVRYFLKRGFSNLSACDLTSQAVTLAKRSLELYGLDTSVDIKVGNAEDLPYEDESVDHINCQGVIHHTPDTQKCIDEFFRVLKPGGTLCFSVYYKSIVLRHKILFKIVSHLLRRVVGLSGRGRESILYSENPDEIVRIYDGIDNPIGKAFTRKELESMLNGMFQITRVCRTFFPARAMPIRIPKVLHRWLHKKYGLLIVIRASKTI